MVGPSRYNVGGDEADIIKNKLGIAVSCAFTLLPALQE